MVCGVCFPQVPVTDRRDDLDSSESFRPGVVNSFDFRNLSQFIPLIDDD